jgi:hypothetical protein
MLPTLQCKCGKHLLVDEAHPDEPAVCPACGALVTSNRRPVNTSIQAEEPRRPIASINDRHEPATDIRKRWRPGLGTVFVLVATGCVIFWAYGFFVLTSGPLGPSQRDTAVIQARALAQVCDNYRLKHGKFPENLQILLMRDPLIEGVWIDDSSKLLDTWGKPYQYDAKGKMNLGLHADVWTVTPDGVEIGNWQNVR